MSEMFKLIKNDYIEGRPNVLVLNCKDYKVYDENKGFYVTVIKHLRNQANVFVLKSTNKNLDKFNECKNNAIAYINNPKQFKEKSSSDTANDENYQMVIDALNTIDFPIFDVVLYPQYPYVCLNAKIPSKISETLSMLGKSFMDYTIEDENFKIVQNYIKEVNENFYKYESFRFCSSHKPLMLMILFKFLSEHNLIKNAVSFIIDPSINTQFIKLNKNHKNYYFTNDHRGTRDYEKFDFAQIQHIIYDSAWYHKKENNRSKNILFVGNIFVNWEHRKDVYDTCFKNLTLKDCDFYIPTTIPINKKYTHLNERIESLKNNPQYHLNGWLPAENIPNLLDNYKYGLCLNCITHFDSLNLRPVLYVIHDVLPLLQDYYDPEGLWIPLDIQEKIVFKNSDDIVRIVNYFNSHEDERQELLTKLKKLFKIDSYQNDFENTFTKEMRKVFPWYKYEPIETIYNNNCGKSNDVEDIEEW